MAWFNTNKELSWALNGADNTGLAAYNTVIADSRYTGPFNPMLAPPTVTESTKTNPTKGGGGGKRSTTTSATLMTAESTALEGIQQEREAGIQRALAVSKMPEVVGTALLAREAQGFRNLPPAARAVLRKDMAD